MMPPMHLNARLALLLTLPPLLWAGNAVVGTTDTQTLTNKRIASGTTVKAGPTMTLGSDATGDLYYRNGSGVHGEPDARLLNRVC